MDRLDMEFFDKYKDVDKFCGDMLSPIPGFLNTSTRWIKLLLRKGDMSLHGNEIIAC